MLLGLVFDGIFRLVAIGRHHLMGHRVPPVGSLEVILLIRSGLVVNIVLV